MTRLAVWKQRAREMRRDIHALYLAYRHPCTPWYAKALAAAVVAYAFSPIDLIPDFIPVLGYLDDLILVPAGIVLAIMLIPAPVMAECRRKAAQSSEGPGRGGPADQPRGGLRHRGDLDSRGGSRPLRAIRKLGLDVGAACPLPSGSGRG
jgi:uncharacterized membrane protein YkvA (DUF1232 family)